MGVSLCVGLGGWACWVSWKNVYQHGYVHGDNGMKLKVVDMVDGDIRDGQAW